MDKNKKRILWGSRRYLHRYILRESYKKRKGLKKSIFFTVLNEEINYYRKQGDVNARTGNETDFIEYDNFDGSFGIDNYNNQHARNSEDEIINTRGKELLDLCKLNDFLIANGRNIGDLLGNFTSHQLVQRYGLLTIPKHLLSQNI